MSEKIRVWDVPVRVFHWLLAGSFAGAYLVSESEQLRGVHMILGYTTMGLIAFRIIWGFVGSPFARFQSFLFPPSAAIGYLRGLSTGNPGHYLGHNPAGSYAIYAILLVGMATGVTGYLSLNEIGGESVEDIHELCANVWLGVVIVHVAGVIIGSWVHRENLVRAMVTGYKRGVARPAVETETGSARGRLVGVCLAAGVAVFWIWGLLTGSFQNTGSEQGGRGGEKDQGQHENMVSGAGKPDVDD